MKRKGELFFFISLALFVSFLHHQFPTNPPIHTHNQQTIPSLLSSPLHTNHPLPSPHPLSITSFKKERNKKAKKFASAGNRTRTASLEGRHHNHLTTDATAKFLLQFYF